MTDAGRRRRIDRKLLTSGLRFAVATMFSASLSFVLPLVLHAALGVSERAAVATSFAIAYAVNFIALRSMVFRSRGGLARDLTRYAVVNALFRVAEYGAFIALRGALPAIGYAGALLAVLGVSTVVKFFAYKRLFGDR